MFLLIALVPEPHRCNMVDCMVIGEYTFSSDCEEGTDGYLFDKTHWEHPDWSYERVEDAVFNSQGD